MAKSSKQLLAEMREDIRELRAGVTAAADRLEARQAMSPAALAKAAANQEAANRLAKAQEDAALDAYLDGQIAGSTGFLRARAEAVREGRSRA
jgi:hypothetical protein